MPLSLYTDIRVNLHPDTMAYLRAACKSMMAFSRRHNGNGSHGNKPPLSYLQKKAACDAITHARGSSASFLKSCLDSGSGAAAPHDFQGAQAVPVRSAAELDYGVSWLVAFANIALFNLDNKLWMPSRSQAWWEVSRLSARPAGNAPGGATATPGIAGQGGWLSPGELDLLGAEALG